MEDFLFEHRKLAIIFCVCLTIFIITGISYSFFSAKGLILKSDLSCNFRENVYLKDFIYKLDGTLQNDYKIDTNFVGIKNLKIIYKDYHGFYKVKNFSIEIKDVTPPFIKVDNDYTIKKGYSRKIEDSILCVDDTDDDVECTVDGSYNLDEVGSYMLTISAMDKSGNSTEKDFRLNVIDDNKGSSINTNTGDSNVNSSYISYSDIYKKYKKNNTMIGIDVSKWQGDIDFKELKENNVEFVMIKFGGQKKINDKIVIDPNFERNIMEANRYNIKAGVYFYSYATTIREAKKQAKFVINSVKKYKVDLPISFDWENWDEYNEFNLSMNSLNKIGVGFVDEINNNGYDSLLYSSEYYLDNIWFSDLFDDVWLANYGTVNYKGKYRMWQLCSDGRVDGINSLVDIDILYLK